MIVLIRAVSWPQPDFLNPPTVTEPPPSVLAKLANLVVTAKTAQQTVGADYRTLCWRIRSSRRNIEDSHNSRSLFTRTPLLSLKLLLE
jgi:hypothetical protein